MGRSANSRNRVFVKEGNDLKTQAFDPSKLVDPSLIIYAPVRTLENATIVTNGDQTDTARDFILEGKTFEEALRTRTFEPDPPNFTPRISGILEFADGDFSYKMSILKSNCGRENSALRFFYEANKLGLVDPDSYNQTFDMVAQKYKEGRILYSFWNSLIDFVI